MSEFGGLEFTGERIVPGLVDSDLLNEHLARYRFAARFGADLTQRAAVLDAGCGAGYGTKEFAPGSRVVGIDISPDAVAYAKRTFARPGVHFLQGSCDSLPVAEGSFDLIAAFEVIEHLERWETMLTEARRVLRPGGVLLVSTPNKAYYAEARGAAGPNPYHVREFEYHEFEAALRVVFPHVNLWSQNHSEAIAFVPLAASSASAGDFDAARDAMPEHAHFFLAACSQSPIPESRAFAWLPAAGNVLRQRERHIALLESEVSQKTAWLEKCHQEHAFLQARHEDLLEELRTTHAGYQARVRELEQEAGVRLEWARDLEGQIGRGTAQIARLEEENAERTRWAQSLDARLLWSQEQLRRARRSTWVRLGRLLRLGPEITTGDGQPE